MKNERLPIVDKSFCDILELLFTQEFYRNFNPKNYPPYNIVTINDESQAASGSCLYRIDVAVAGFSTDNIAVSVDNDNTLLISGAIIKYDDKKTTFIHRGISQRPFHLKFKLSPDVIVMTDDVCLNDGILSVSLTRKEPPQMKVTIKTRGNGDISQKPKILLS